MVRYSRVPLAKEELNIILNYLEHAVFPTPQFYGEAKEERDCVVLTKNSLVQKLKIVLKEARD